jgi:imidazole glycerol-phosphate synthase subunit HisH
MIAAVIWCDNLTACQFHPEKSQATGLAMYANFVAMREKPETTEPAH